MIGAPAVDVRLIAAAQSGNLTEVSLLALAYQHPTRKPEAPRNFAYATLIALFAGHEAVARVLLNQKVLCQRDLDGMFMMAQTQARHALRRTAMPTEMAKVLEDYGLKVPDLPFAVG